MPKINPDYAVTDPISKTIEPLLSNITITTNPIVITAVNRKISLGNFETLDLFCALASPVDWSNLSPEEIQEALQYAADASFSFTSQQTGQRYDMIKALQKGGRPDTPAP